MTQSHMDFDAAPEQEARPQWSKVSFKLRGETFECAPVIPDWVAIEMAAAREEDREGFRSSAALDRFFRAAIHPRDLDRFFELLKRPWAPVVTAEEQTEGLLPGEEPGPPEVLDPGWTPIGESELGALVEWMAQTYAGRPTSPPGVSPRRPSSSGRSSGAGSSSRVSVARDAGV